VLFEDPERRSTSVGVTVSPVRVASIDQFGDLQAVGQRLLQAEQKKVCVRAWERAGGGGGGAATSMAAAVVCQVWQGPE
jgi:hypothetical protein